MKKFAFHPYLLAVFFVLNTFTTVYGLSLSRLLVPVLVLLVFVFLLNRAVVFFTGDGIKSGIVTSIILALILYYLQFHALFNDIFPGLARHRYFFPLMSVSAFLLARWVLKTRKPLALLSEYLNVVSLCFVIYGVALLGGALMRQAELPGHEEIAAMVEHESQPVTHEEIEKRPDIYYIILDAYASAKTLEEFLGFSNDDFIGRLEERGFYVAHQSRAISTSTIFSMASTLNLTDDRRLLRAPPDVAFRMIQDSAVERTLDSAGYETVNLSLFPLAGSDPFYRVFTNPDSSYMARMFQNTLFYVLAFTFEQHNMHRRNLAVFSALRKVPRQERRHPLFVYAHLFTPHHPYIFDRNAEIIPFWRRKTDCAAYIEQVQGTNRLVLEAIDGILLESEEEPVIIIQGDHGYRRGKHAGETGLSILNAFYLPGRGRAALYRSIPAYKTFRVLFNEYFNTSYGMPGGANFNRR